MKITILGTGGALPPPGRAQTGLFIEKGKRCLLIDCGSGVLMRLDQAGVDLTRIETVLLTHHHLDHMSDLLPLIVARWLRERTHTRIYGPEGTAGLIERLLELYNYVRQHVTLEAHELKSGDQVEIEGFSIECLATRHTVPTLAYKIDEQFVFSGDTAPFPEMAEFAKGCEILLHECSFPDGFAIPHHTTPSALGQALKGCDAKTLLLTHFYPQTQGREEEIIQAVKKGFSGDIELAEDLLRVEL